MESQPLTTQMIVIISAFVLILALVITIMILKMKTRLTDNKVLSRNYIVFSSVTCPKCQKEMEKGFVPIQKGIYYRNINEKPFTQFLSVKKLLKNTLSFGVSQLELQSWHCNRCNYLLINHNERYGK
jgi:phage FluMu protein Com